MINYNCAPVVTVEKRSSNSLVVLGLFNTLKDCKPEATSVYCMLGICFWEIVTTIYCIFSTKILLAEYHERLLNF